ncbi:MAG TPA: helix-turn-helix domain-containing protein [Actinopolymorphaceae bacterium]
MIPERSAVPAPTDGQHRARYQGDDYMADKPRERRLLTTRQVADMFGVRDVTVFRWGASGKLASFDEPGHHRRYFADEVERMFGRATGQAGATVEGDGAA